MDPDAEVIDTALMDEPVVIDEAEAEPDVQAKAKSTGKGTTYEELALPQATIVKIIKDFLPNQAVLSKEAKDIFRKISAYFILYITDCAAEIAMKKKRKTILPEDILAALQELDFHDMTARLNQILAARKRQQTKSKSSPTLKAPSPPDDTENAALTAVTDELEDLEINFDEEVTDEVDQDSPAAEDLEGHQDNMEAFVEMQDEQRREVDITAFTASDDEE